MTRWQMFTSIRNPSLNDKQWKDRDGGGAGKQDEQGRQLDTVLLLDIQIMTVIMSETPENALERCYRKTSRVLPVQLKCVKVQWVCAV